MGEEIVCDWAEVSPATIQLGVAFSDGDTNVMPRLGPSRCGWSFWCCQYCQLGASCGVANACFSGSYYSDGLVQFSAFVSDAEDEVEDLIVTWTSSVDGELSMDTSTMPTVKSQIILT